MSSRDCGFPAAVILLRQSRNRGAGLGVAVVRRLVEAHGGAVDIAAVPAGGARVTIELPVFRAV
jgi:signal transduction histidine kinase